jgi:acetyltransferase-like isoleucine patch superfamily enzyme
MAKLTGMNGLLLRIKKADSPLTRLIKNTYILITNPGVPPLPRGLRKVLRIFYEAHFLAIVLGRAVITILYRNPLFQARCASFGRNVTIAGKLPFVTGPVEIYVGNNVYIGGNVSILSGNLGYQPKLILKDNSSLGWNAVVAVNKEVVIEENVRIPHDVRISDSDGHPKQADLRRANLPPDDKDIRPVRICRDAWIGNGTHIMKGVTIGEGAIIGANSVVITDIPPFSLALGNPAEVYFKNYGKPSTASKAKLATPNPEPANSNQAV